MSDAELTKIERPPRIQPALPSGTINIPKPPDLSEEGRARLIQIALPLATIIGYVLVSALGGSGRSPWLMIPMALSVVASSGYSLYTFRNDRRKRAERERSYADQLMRLADEMQRSHEQQRRFYSYNHPDPQAALRIVRQTTGQLRQATGLRPVARLWERRAEDTDFGVVRFGLGALPSTVLYELNDQDLADTPQARAARKLVEDARYVAETPLLLNLRPPDPDAPQPGPDSPPPLPIPTAHAVAITGPSQAVYPVIRAMLVHFVTLHAHSDAQLYVLATNKAEWEWTHRLPHCRPGEYGRSVQLMQEPQQHSDDDEPPLDQFLEGLRRRLAQRKIRLQERDGERGDDDPRQPFCLLIVDLHEANHPRLANLEADPAIGILLAEGATLGAAVIFLVPDRTAAPSNCQALIEVEETTATTGSQSDRRRLVQVRYAETGRNSQRFVGEADLLISDDGRNDFRSVLARIEKLDVRRGLGANLPPMVSLLTLHEVKTLSELRGKAQTQWRSGGQPGASGWLRARLGVVSGNKPRQIVFSARRDGVHALIAGSTGVGKSQLLISLISTLATNYDPTTLNFVLVDYKGGSALKAFERLPHVVDLITNLQHGGVGRMFTAIEAELQRRQELLNRANAGDILEYRQRGYHLDPRFSPLPFLFLVIDEFVEMIGERSEFRSQLESIARLGRSLGVSLVLASQRPSGLSDQMRANLKLRICLRVENQAESREMLRRTDAVFLPAGIQGRGYIQAGTEEIELIQIAYAGEAYRDPTEAPAKPIQWPERPGYTPGQDQEPPKLYESLIEQLAALARDEGCPTQMAPWPGFLPTQLALSQTLITSVPNETAVTAERYLLGLEQVRMGQPTEERLTFNPSINRWLAGECGWIEPLNWDQYALRPVIGLIDDPQRARQLPLVLDLRRGHYCVFGASGWGKSVLLRTLLLSLAAAHGPDRLHIYALDLGGRALAPLGGLPHLGALITPEEGYEELVGQLIRELEEQIELRKKQFGTAIDDLYAYNQSHPDQALPAIVVAIDNLLEFSETFNQGRDDSESVFERLIALARQSRSYGIHLIVSVNQLADLSNQLFNLFTERLALHLSDPADYRAIMGTTLPSPGEIPGRGYVRSEGRPLVFQAALPLSPLLDANGQLIDGVSELIRPMNELVAQAATNGQPYALPTIIRRIPAKVFLRDIVEQRNALQGAPFWPTLETQVRNNWRVSTEPANTDWLRVEIGAIAGNKPRELRLEAKRDGVHALIAGGTGAGKSELLTSFILGLAMRYDPSVLNFVLVDYKGGGAFAPFKGRLPHVVDVITNLNKAAVQRVFTAIRAELNRRMKLSADHGGVDIVAYRQRGLHLTTPYPHLVIIIDEFAELITDNQEFSAELDSITRVGRSIGVNLVLASQRPIGVTDQMRANIKLRICLRVEGPDVSREMLRRTDAAFLPSTPGRGYLQVGNDSIELIQAAFAGEVAADAPRKETGEEQRFFEAVIAMTDRMVPQANRPAAPWPPMLPPALTFSQPLQARYLPTDPPPPAEATLLPAVTNWLDSVAQWPSVDWGDSALRATVALLDNPSRALQLPLQIDLMRGHAVIFGAPSRGKSTLLRALALSLTATHSPAELHLHSLDLGGGGLGILTSLPHMGTIITPERGYEERVRELWRQLTALIATRKLAFVEAEVQSLAEYNRKTAVPLPALVVLIDNIPDFFESFGNTNQRDDPNGPLEIFLGLLRQGRSFGVHFVITANRPAQLNTKLISLFTERLTLSLADAEEYSLVVGSGLREIEPLPGRGALRGEQGPLLFQVALVPGAVDAEGRVRNEAQLLRTLGTHMQQAADGIPPPLRIGALEDRCSYRDWLVSQLPIQRDDPELLAHIKQYMRQCWAKSIDPTTTDWLNVTLGLRSGNTPRRLYLKASDDGVHGLIAGGTGSGKSELLMTLIIGLAIEHDPEVLNFVLVDFKGGGAFQPFSNLPHVVDLVTNLNKAGVHRVFTALDAELRRRQALNAETATKDIVEYRRKGLQKTHGPFPHLFVIIDEYAEMIEQNREFLPQLESITRVGRSIGVNLLLASQRPRGVTDQMRANIKLRMCLRVEEQDTSRELLRRPDAALLPGNIPGRGYLQIGNDEIELVQVGFTGEAQLDTRTAAVSWPERSTIVPTGDPPRLYDAIVMLAAELTDGAMAPRRWPAMLPNQLSLLSLCPSAPLAPALAQWLGTGELPSWPTLDWDRATPKATVGLVDHPAMSCQFALELEPAQGHIALFGDSGSGKSTFLRTLVVALAVAYSPRDLQCYALDLGGRTLRSLEALPHVGTVIYADDERFDEQLQRLLEVLSAMADRRQQLISDDGATSFANYNARHPEAVLPLTLLLIDNFADLRARYESVIENTLLPLARRSLGLGLVMVVTANVPSILPTRLYNLFGERLTLRQTSQDQYLDIVGRGAVELDELPGRGYWRYDRRPLVFQTALPTGIFNHEGRPLCPEAVDLAAIAATMQAALGTKELRATPIEILRNQVPLETLLPTVPSTSAEQVVAILGRSASLETLVVDLAEQGPHMLLVGPPQSGKTTALRTLLLSLTLRYSPEQVRLVLIDVMQGRLFGYGGQRRLDDLPHVIEAIDDPAHLPNLVAHLAESCLTLATSRRPLFVIIDGLEDLEAELDSRSRGELANLLRKYGSDGLHVIASSAADATPGDLRRRLLAGGLGLGLKSSQAVESLLRGARPPGALRDRELPRGRGYLVRSGQAQMLQVATLSDGTSSGEGRRAQAEALDRWVERVLEQYRGANRATWPRLPTTSPELQMGDRLTLQMAELVRTLARRELHRLQQGTPADLNLIELLFDSSIWSDRERLRRPLSAELLRLYSDQGLEELAHGIINNDEYLINDLLPKLQRSSGSPNGKER